ncbi:hypothetical protein J6590_005686 [Homalodisca vitripennis]|nr:hypothetical protein J6590_005686 [Homalodisca vitripennis]
MDILSSEDERMNEEDLRKSMELYEEEKMLTKEIQDLEKAEIEVDTETDDAETDSEATLGNEEEDTNCRITALKASYENVCDHHNASGPPVTIIYPVVLVNLGETSFES